MARHPQISNELLLSDGYVEVVNEGVDTALRFGRVNDSSLRVRHLDNVWRFGKEATQLIITVHGNRVANDTALPRDADAWRFRDL